MDLPVSPPFKPMLAKATAELPAGAEGDWWFEPKWDGFRCLVFRHGDEVELASRNTRPLVRYFPELVAPLRASLPERCVVDGEVVIATRDGLDFDALQQRIHPAESRIGRLAAETPASYVAFDLIASADDDLRDTGFAERRPRLEAALTNAKAPIHLTPVTTDRSLATDWFTRFEGAGLDGVIAKAATEGYRSDARGWRKVKHERTADCVVAGYRTHKDGAGIGSLLLGLYDTAGELHHMGVASSFSATRRRELVDEVAGLEVDDLADHPWARWAEASAHASGGRMPGAPSRWNADKDLSFTPLRPERVVEVAYERVDAGRFRHSARFRRWRPDRDPSSCGFTQLEVVPPVELTGVLGATG